jgi:hypothetical protein
MIFNYYLLFYYRADSVRIQMIWLVIAFAIGVAYWGHGGEGSGKVEVTMFWRLPGAWSELEIFFTYES